MRRDVALIAVAWGLAHLATWIPAPGAAISSAPGAPVAVSAARSLALGRESLAATVLWGLTVRTFVVHRADPALPAYLAAQIPTVHALDPAWSAPVLLGAPMLASVGALDAEEALLTAAFAADPAEYRYPLMLAANRWTHHRDRDGARAWVRRAAAAPDAPAAVRDLADRAAEAP